MLEIDSETVDENPFASTALIFYTTPLSKNREKIFFNQQAFQIISMIRQNKNNDEVTTDFLSSLCSNWAKSLEIIVNQKSESSQDFKSKPIYLDTIQSFRRKYSVKGAVLQSYYEEKKEKSYIFILQRFVPEDLNLLKIFRKYQLSNREKEIVKLLIHGKGNKQIAYSLGLSQNTIKSYMKLLMRKLGVSNRSGIVAAILSEI